MADLESHIQGLQNQLQSERDQGNPDTPDDIFVLRQHSALMDRFYREMGPACDFRSHLTCVCCFMGTAQHPLPCGHVMCTSCGGVRGIVQLEVLQAIQQYLGDKIPIRTFFDLIVGTSTGGLIAITVGAKNWSLSRCKREFKRFSHHAFTPREFHDLPVLQHLTTLLHGSIYKTQPLYRSLRNALGEGLFYGGRRVDDTRNKTKVAISATESEGRRVILIGNYNRSIDNDLEYVNRQGPFYQFRRPRDPAQELSFWEAAAATSAAPPYFKPFFHESSHCYFLDSALYNNNPARIAQQERKFL